MTCDHAAVLSVLRSVFRDQPEIRADEPSPQRLAQLARDVSPIDPGRFLDAVGELVSAGRFRVDPTMIVSAYLHLHGGEH